MSKKPLAEKSSKKVLCIGAHPDDIEFSMGGTVASMRAQGYHVKILDITNGEPTPYGTVEKRAIESQNAARILDVERKTLQFSNRYLFDSLEVRKAVASEIRTYLPDIIFMHYPQDAHPDHWAASSITAAARFYGKLSKTDMPGSRHYTPRVFYFFSVHLRISPQPDFCLDISDFFEKKIEALLSFESQFKEVGKKHAARSQGMTKEEMVTDYVSSHNRYWGQRSGVRYAEPFYSPEILSLKDLGSLIL